MEIEAQDVGVEAGGAVLLVPTGVLVAPGRRTLVATDAGQDLTAPTALALVLTGRTTPTRGRLLVDGHDVGLWGRDDLRRAGALVDAPGVDEPEPVLPLRAVVAEDLRAAGLAASAQEARAWLAAAGLEGWGHVLVRDLPPSVRTRALAELAAAREGVEVLVLVRPDRAGGDAGEAGGWWDLAGEMASRGLGVAVLVARAEVALLAGAGLLADGDLRAAAGVGRATRPPDLPARPTELAVETTL
ncbi:hypothetical protein [Pseudokineococcus sp. 1T1Z-3]|uniref:hypothetical protein n=1 Tax=Pseudokineococcus sp. 1T1Z-3 TaxID=3132745 RepID=UPI0030AB07FE